MAEGVVLLFDAAADGAVRAVWERLERAGVPSLRSATYGHHRPHVSLVVAERIAAGEWPAVLRDRFFTGEPLRLELAAPALFPGPEGWLILAATATRRLLDGHADLVGSLGAHADGVWEHYLPDAWVPHCTLAGGVGSDRIGAAMAVALAAPLPIVATVETAALVDSETGEMQVLAGAAIPP